MSSKNGTKIGTDNLVGDLGDDVAETRDVLGDTADAAAAKAAGDTRRHSGWWAAIGGGVVAAAAAVGALRWRRARRTPQGRAVRAWRGLTDSLGR
jgi:hypothetical protein